jgi:integrase
MNELKLIDPQARAKAIFDGLDVTEGTRADYKYKITLFLLFVQEHGLSRDSFISFKRMLAARTNLSISTRNKHLIVARIFLKELSRLGHLPDITLNVKSFSQSRRHKVEGLSPIEIEKIAEKINGLPDAPRNNRLRVLFCLLTYQGLRQCEIVRLNFEDINLVSKTALILGKGKDDREPIHLHPNTVEVLRSYTASSRVRNGALFKSLGRRKSNRLGTRTIKREMLALFEQLGIRKTTHSYRHYFVSTLLSNKLDPRVVMKFSRHATINTVLIYDDERDLADRSKEVFKCFEGVKITP